MTEQLPEISGMVLYVYFRGAAGERTSIVTKASWQTVGDELFLTGFWPDNPSISGAFAGKSTKIRFDAVESIVQFESEDEVYEKVYARGPTASIGSIGIPLTLVGIAIVFAHYLGKVPDDLAWIGWVMGVVGWMLRRQQQ